MTRLTIRIDFDKAGRFGPGKARLLEMIAETGSIRAAAAKMRMSYRRAWLLVKDIRDGFGVPVVSTATGGAKGGGTGLTKAGEEILGCYREIEAKASHAAAGPLRKLSKIGTKAAARRATGRKRKQPRA